MDDEQFCEEPERHEYVEIKQLFPANPIYVKHAAKEEKPVLRIDLTKTEMAIRQQLRPCFKKQSEPDEEVEEPQEALHAFEMYYQTIRCVYKRYNNIELNTYRDTKYYSSCFIDRRHFRQNKEELKSLDQLHAELFGQDLNIVSQCGKKQVCFDSNFESGNLFAVFKKSGIEYDLILQNDINSKGNTQWFYFTVANLPQNVEITFNIVNLLKSDSLFNYGMQPVVFSEAKNRKTGETWTRQGRCISYYKNSIRRERSRRYHYTLTFKLTSKIAGDKLHIAHCFPYTYSMLNEYLATQIKNSQRKGLVLNKSTIGKTVGNNPIQVLTITEVNTERKQDSKKIVVIMARQHPGQSQGSFVCEGIIDYLLGKSKEAEFLRKNFIFKIIPMLNADGVIVGNYRTNLMGFDLNRKWDQYDKNKTFPEVNAVKYYISELNKEKKVKIILDLHGHSKKLSSFFYGNPYPQQPEYVRGFPYACSKLSDKVSFEDCTFFIDQEKKKAARVYLSLLHEIIHVYTFESSFYGYTKDNKKVAFGIEEFKGLGSSLCMGLFSFLEFETLMEQKNPDKIEAAKFNKFLNELRENPNLLKIGQVGQSGSESKPEEYQVDLNKIEKPDEIQQQKKGAGQSRASGMFRISVDSLEHPKSTKIQTKKPKANPPRGSTTNPISRKSNRTIATNKQLNKNPRQLQVMQISRVNSVLPDKYQLGLQPANNSTNLNDTDRKSTQRRSARDLKITTAAQTDLILREEWSDLKVIDLPPEQFRSVPRPRPLSSRFKDYEMKYVSLSSGKCKKTLMLKLDLMSRPLQPIYNPLAKYNNIASQTILTYIRPKVERIKLVEHLTSQIGVASDRSVMKDLSTSASRTDQIRSVRLSLKRQTPETFNDVLKKYMICPYDVRGKRVSYNNDDGIFNQKSLPMGSRFDDLVEKPLSIRKKEIMIQKKPVSSRVRQ